ncbi:FadR/GntR family transcriptional regulator [Streptomyces sp. NPDC048425]|uniref:FadR/GntR family transcriptional regulator n=1 Tax=Streptomyces sp. NPDC048425 TaxID=3365548 RepID=UPI0037120C3D
MATGKPEIPRGSLPAHTARRIIRDFTDKGLKPGDGLADEATLIERYGVSRGTLREALRLLNFLGAVTVKPGPQGGPRLGMPGPAVVGSALGMVVQFQGATLRTVFEARLAVEPTVAALAAAHRQDSDLALLDESVAALRATEQKRGPEYAEHAVTYSLRVAEASQNALLATIVPALVAMNSTASWRYPEGSRPELTERVSAVVEAIRNRSGDDASRHTHDMIKWLVDALQSSQPADLERRILWPDLDEVLSQGL